MAIQLLLILLIVCVTYRRCCRCGIIDRVTLRVFVFVRYHHKGIHLDCVSGSVI